MALSYVGFYFQKESSETWLPLFVGIFNLLYKSWNVKQEPKPIQYGWLTLEPPCHSSWLIYVPVSLTTEQCSHLNWMGPTHVSVGMLECWCHGVWSLYICTEINGKSISGKLTDFIFKYSLLFLNLSDFVIQTYLHHLINQFLHKMPTFLCSYVCQYAPALIFTGYINGKYIFGKLANSILQRSLLIFSLTFSHSEFVASSHLLHKMPTFLLVAIALVDIWRFVWSSSWVNKNIKTEMLFCSW